MARKVRCISTIMGLEISTETRISNKAVGLKISEGKETAKKPVLGA